MFSKKISPAPNAPSAIPIGKRDSVDYWSQLQRQVPRKPSAQNRTTRGSKTKVDEFFGQDTSSHLYYNPNGQKIHYR